ncbi:MAG: conserved phage C-terminal domain-containing protein [Paraclostridium sp.]
MISFYEEFLDNQDLNYKEKMVLVQMVRLKIAQINITVASLCKALDISEKTVVRITKSLQSKDVLVVKKDYSKFSFGTPIYLINIPVSPQVTEHIKQVHNIFMPGHVIECLSEVTGQSYILTKEVQDLIQKRIDEGFKLDEFKKVIETCYHAWIGTTFESNLNPLYLFNENFYKRLKY